MSLRGALFALSVCLAFSIAPAGAQMGAFSGFDSIHAPAIQSNARTGGFTIPGRFTATRSGTQISGDSASGNAVTKLVTIDGNVVVHLTHSLSLAGEASDPNTGPSTLTCDHLDIDGEHRLYHAVGRVSYVQGARSFRADRADMDEATNQLRLEGHISIAGAMQGQSSSSNGFDTMRTATINSNSHTGEFSIPSHFIATRQGVEISGDHARGYLGKSMSVFGHVIVHMPRRSATLTCERLNIDEAQRVYHANGNVHYREPSQDFSADHADINNTTAIVHLTGNVHVWAQ